MTTTPSPPGPRQYFDNNGVLVDYSNLNTQQYNAITHYFSYLFNINSGSVAAPALASALKVSSGILVQFADLGAGVLGQYSYTKDFSTGRQVITLNTRYLDPIPADVVSPTPGSVGPAFGLNPGGTGGIVDYLGPVITDELAHGAFPTLGNAIVGTTYFDRFTVSQPTGHADPVGDFFLQAYDVAQQLNVFSASYDVQFLQEDYNLITFYYTSTSNTWLALKEKIDQGGATSADQQRFENLSISLSNWLDVITQADTLRNQLFDSNWNLLPSVNPTIAGSISSD